ncbi:MAG TPA: UTRA domain-containing protein, partial [Actinomycetota bacterium]|nr:UTRA domain-containing protein [Actinomycetota bacterium]
GSRGKKGPLTSVIASSHSCASVDPGLVEGTRVEDPASEPWPGGTIAQLESLGVEVTEIAEDVAARAPRPEEVRDLRLGAGTPVFEVVRTMFADERPIATSSIIIAGDRYVLSYRIPLQ